MGNADGCCWLNNWGCADFGNKVGTVNLWE